MRNIKNKFKKDIKMIKAGSTTLQEIKNQEEDKHEEEEEESSESKEDTPPPKETKRGPNKRNFSDT